MKPSLKKLLKDAFVTKCRGFQEKNALGWWNKMARTWRIYTPAHYSSIIALNLVSYDLLLEANKCWVFIRIYRKHRMDEGELRSHLECPVCTMVPHSTKILACKNSHQICQVCYDKIKSDPKSCPQGRCKYSSPPTQLRAIEEMISQAKVKLNCKHSRCGCQESDNFLVEQVETVKTTEGGLNNVQWTCLWTVVATVHVSRGWCGHTLK